MELEDWMGAYDNSVLAAEDHTHSPSTLLAFFT